MSLNDRTKQSPGTSLAVNMKHPQDLKDDVFHCLTLKNWVLAWRNLTPRIAEVANTWTLEPNMRTNTDEETTTKSEEEKTEFHKLVKMCYQ